MPSYQALDIIITAGANDGTDDETTFSTGFEGTLLGQGFDIVQHSWFAWIDAAIPTGFTCTRADITFQASNTAAEFAAGTVLSNIYGIDEDDHAVPTTHAQWNTDHGLHTTAFVPWDFTAVSSGTLVTPNIASVLQEIFDRGGWAAGNNIGIHIDDDGTANPTSQELVAFEHTTLNQGVLHIEGFYGSAIGGGGGFSAISEFAISEIPSDAAPPATVIPIFDHYYRQQRRRNS